MENSFILILGISLGVILWECVTQRVENNSIQKMKRKCIDERTTK